MTSLSWRPCSHPLCARRSTERVQLAARLSVSDRMRHSAAASFVHRASGSRGRFRNCRQLAQSSARPENSRVPDPTSNTAFLRVSGTGEGRHVYWWQDCAVSDSLSIPAESSKFPSGCCSSVRLSSASSDIDPAPGAARSGHLDRVLHPLLDSAPQLRGTLSIPELYRPIGPPIAHEYAHAMRRARRPLLPLTAF
jgi:hypothetical protein